MDTLNDFFSNATPAQINQLDTTQQPPELPSPVAEPVQEEVQEEAAQEAPQVAQPEEQQQQPEEPKETPSQMRFRELRERMLKAEWEREQLTKRLAAMETERAPRQPEKDEDLDLGIAPDELLEGKHLDKIIKAVEKRSEAKFRQQQAQTMQTMVETRLKAEIPDLDAVVNSETISKLQAEYPDIASSIYSNPDLYSKAKAAYTMITKLGLANPVDYSQDKQRIKQNLAKPKHVSSINTRPSALSQAESFESASLSEQTKEQLWKEMRKAMNA